MMRGAIVTILLAACGPGQRDSSIDANGHRDAPGGSPDASTADAAEMVYVYAHSPTALYRVDPDTLAITLVGNFTWPANVIADSMTDLAIDQNGRMIGISYTAVYQVDPATAKCTQLASMLQGGGFNGLSFVPASALGQTGDDVLVATRNGDGLAFQVDPMTGTIMQVGNMGGTFVSSGDLVGVENFGVVQTVPGANGAPDQLVMLTPGTLAATPIGTSNTGFTHIWGVAYWKNKVYGFTAQGEFVLIDTGTGVGSLVSTVAGVQWWGAAVTTVAPIVQ